MCCFVYSCCFESQSLVCTASTGDFHGFVYRSELSHNLKPHNPKLYSCDPENLGQLFSSVRGSFGDRIPLNVPVDLHKAGNPLQKPYKTL